MSYTKELKKKAMKMRNAGKSYAIIRKELGIPKSTLSTWFSKSHGHIFNKEKQLVHLQKARVLAAEAIQRRILKRNQEIINTVSKEFKIYPVQDTGFKKSILAALYWAEGAKHETVNGVKFANTDPKMMKLFITLLRNCFTIDESRITVRLHLHYYHGKKESRRFWAKTLDVPEAQFALAFVKKRSRKKRFRKNFMGICFLYYYDSNVRRQFMEISKQLYMSYCK